MKTFTLCFSLDPEVALKHNHDLFFHPRPKAILDIITPDKINLLKRIIIKNPRTTEELKLNDFEMQEFRDLQLLGLVRAEQTRIKEERRFKSIFRPTVPYDRILIELRISDFKRPDWRQLWGYR